jgi:hypothetical protein
VPVRAEGPATDERTRSLGCGQDPGRKGDEVHRVSRRCEVATRVSPGAQLVHLTESAASGGLPRSGCVSRCKAPRAFKEKAAALLILGDTNEYLYWNFTTNARRGSLLHALDARVKGAGDVF